MTQAAYITGTFMSDKGEKQTYHTHSSWIDEPYRSQLFKLVDTKPYCCRASAVITWYLMLEVVNRVKFFSKYPLKHRAAFVIVPGLLAHVATNFLYEWAIRDDINTLIARGNTPYWKYKHRVPEANRVYFELDDSNNFQPNILHHGMSDKTLENFYPELVMTASDSLEAAKPSKFNVKLEKL